jgi:prepilin-type N-terminal cleavage/methylation domain-containing protein
MRRSDASRQAGFTLIELLVAMAIFSFILLIIVSGFLMVMRMRNKALAYNMVQDSARTAMNELVRAVRDSSGVVPASVVAGPNGAICLQQTGGQVLRYYVTGGILTRATACTAPFTNAQAITNSSVRVTRFDVRQENSSATNPNIKPEMLITLTVASNNGTAVVAADGSATCSTNSHDLPYCAVQNLTSGAVPR